MIFGDISDGIDGVFALAAWWPVLKLRAAMRGLRPGCSVVLNVGRAFVLLPASLPLAHAN